MDWTMVESNWAHFQDKVRGRWSKLAHGRIVAIAGNRAQLVSELQAAYGISEQIAESQVRDFELRNREYRPFTSSCSKWRVVNQATQPNAAPS
jgi:uncharacterized protein YjbJ (UPF0337 family)